MRLSSLSRGNEPFLGARRGDALVDVNAALPTLAARDVSALLRLPELDLGALAAAIAGAADTTLVPMDAAVSFRPLLPTAGKILCLGVNFVDHAKESSHDKPAYPVVFGRWPSSFVGHEQPLVVPAVSHHFDYESELLVVIGKRGHRITREAALSHVAGYSLMNDGSIRDYQKRTAQWTVGKNFDASGSLGPELVTADELPAGAVGLRLTGKLNGVVMQEASTSDMIFDVVDAIVSLSEGMALEPGDAIAMGTPGGVGFVRTPPVFMRAGDVFEIEVERVGVLRNGIVDEGLAGRLERVPNTVAAEGARPRRRSRRPVIVRTRGRTKARAHGSRRWAAAAGRRAGRRAPSLPRRSRW